MLLNDAPREKQTQAAAVAPWRRTSLTITLLLAAAMLSKASDTDQSPHVVPEDLKKLSLEQLSQIEVTTVSKQPFPGPFDTRGHLRGDAGADPAFRRDDAS